MSKNYSKFKDGIELFPQNNNPPSELGDLRYNSSTNKVELYNGSIDPVVTENDVATLTNKTFTSPIVSPGTPNVVIISDGSGALTQSSTSTTELSYINNVTSDIQAQLDGKQPTIAILPIANGGTGQPSPSAAFDALSPMTTGGDIIYGGTSGTGTRLPNGTSGQVLLSNGGTAAPSWGTVLTNPMTTGGDIIFADAGGVPDRLANGTVGQLLQSNGGTTAPSWATVGGYVPPGTIIQFAGPFAPSGYLLAEGQAVSRTTFSALYTAIGNSWGIGDGSTTFNLPNLSGRFARGQNLELTGDPDSAARTQQTSGTFTVSGGSTILNNATVTVSTTANLAVGMTITGTNIPANSVVFQITSGTTLQLGNLNNSVAVLATGTTGSLTFTFSKSAVGNYVGSIQADGFKSHTHTAPTKTYSSGAGVLGTYLTNLAGMINGIAAGALGGTETPTTNTAIAATGGNETRPINAYVLYCIKT